MNTTISLSMPPIKEIIFTISFNKPMPKKILSTFIEIPEIKNIFSIKSEIKEFEINLDDIDSNSSLNTAGYVLEDENKTSILQIRRGSLSIHKINLYESSETLIKLLNDYWQKIVEIYGEISIENLSVRYINSIDMEEHETIRDLITITIEHPFGSDLVKSCFSHQNLIYKSFSPIIVADVVTTYQANNRQIILDIILNTQLHTSNSDKEGSQLINVFKNVKDVKNDIFFKSITAIAINKYK